MHAHSSCLQRSLLRGIFCLVVLRYPFAPPGGLHAFGRTSPSGNHSQCILFTRVLRALSGDHFKMRPCTSKGIAISRTLRGICFTDSRLHEGSGDVFSNIRHPRPPGRLHARLQVPSAMVNHIQHFAKGITIRHTIRRRLASSLGARAAHRVSHFTSAIDAEIRPCTSTDRQALDRSRCGTSIRTLACRHILTRSAASSEGCRWMGRYRTVSPLAHQTGSGNPSTPRSPNTCNEFRGYFY